MVREEGKGVRREKGVKRGGSEEVTEGGGRR